MHFQWTYAHVLKGKSGGERLKLYTFRDRNRLKK